MTKVITYGTYDMIHYGHVRLLERAKELGDYLIVGVTSDDFDKSRGKINVNQSLTERIDAVKSLNIADEIIVEEYEGQKIDDIRRYDVDIFTVGDDWKGHFDYLKEYCQVVYLDRTKGISSSQIRSNERNLEIGIVGEYVSIMDKFARECEFVNGIMVSAICTKNKSSLTNRLANVQFVTSDYEELLDKVDAIYLAVHPELHDTYIKKALNKRKHVICETPISISKNGCKELYEIAKENGCILMEAIKTAYALAFERLLLLLKTGIIGEVISVDATCTSLRKKTLFDSNGNKQWGSLYEWGSFAMLPVFAILGTDYKSKHIQTKLLEDDYDLFTKVDFIYENAVASIKVGAGVKSESDLIISGTEGYVYVPAPWWKTDYFEIRFENFQDNKKCFYQLDGEGIRYMILNFVKSITNEKENSYVSRDISMEISSILNDFREKKNITII